MPSQWWIFGRQKNLFFPRTGREAIAFRLRKLPQIVDYFTRARDSHALRYR
jgi:hypothetical protein